MVAGFTRSIASLLLLGAVSLAAQAQTAEKPYRVGAVGNLRAEVLATRAHPVQVAFEQGLRERGWIEGKNLQILYRGTNDDNRQAVLDELIRLPVDVLVMGPGKNLEYAMRATSTIPIVTHMDAVTRSAVAKSLSRPARNVTGISTEAQGGVAMKRLGLLRQAAPIKRVARLYFESPLRFGTEKDVIPEYGIAARDLGLEIIPVWAGNAEELRSAFAELSRRGVNGLSVGPGFGRTPWDPRTDAWWETLLEQVARHRIPAIYDVPHAVEHGGMMAYGDDHQDRWRRLSHFIDRILRGAKPADLPIEQPSGLRTVVNLKAADSIGVRIPTSILLQADRVIR